jgi:hypothetical protein
MDNQAGQDTNTSSESLKTILPPKHHRKVWVYMLGGVAVIFLLAAAYLYKWGLPNYTENPLVLYGPRQQSAFIRFKRIGSEIDYQTYLQIKNSTAQAVTSYLEVARNTLQGFDMDGDGDEDVVGFLQSHDDRPRVRFATWLRNNSGFDYYEDTYSEFEFGGQYDTGRWCHVTGLMVDKITFVCTSRDQEYQETLHYQKNGVGYYRDVDADVVTFSNTDNWPQYSSSKGGIAFNYQPDVKISEQTYAIYKQLITIITAKRDNRILFEIHSVPFSEDLGGGVVTPSQSTIFLKLPEGTYLSRDWLGGQTNQQITGVFYSKTRVNQKNNVGSIFSSYDAVNVEKNRKYTLYTPLKTETELKEIDKIFASIKYLGTSAALDANNIPLQNNSFMFAKLVTMDVPGHISDKPVFEKDEGVVEETSLDVTFIPSPVYAPAQIHLQLYPFGSVGGTNPIGGGGYNLEKNACFDYEKSYIPLQKLGTNEVCEFGFGDGGFSLQGYYILDPNRKYILSLSLENGDSGNYQILHPDLETIAASARFKAQ